MKHIPLFTFAFALHLSLFASPFAPDQATEVVVYSPSSSSTLHVSTFSTNPLDSAVSRAFPSTYTGHRAVCPIPRTTTNDVFASWSGGPTYSPGDPFGVSTGRDYPIIELTRTTSITPRIDLWSGSSDRAVVFGPDRSDFEFIPVPHAQTPNVRVSVVRHRFNVKSPFECGVTSNTVAYAGDFTSDARTFLHEGDFLATGLDIDWDHLYADSVANFGTYRLIGALTNVTYLIVFDGQIGANSQGTDTKALETVIERRFEKTRKVPNPISSRSTTSSTSFSFAIIGEDIWASQFGTTYTAFKIKVLNGSTETWDSGIRRLPPRDKNGVYTFQTSKTFQTSQTLTWRIALYNSKFKTDTIMSNDSAGVHEGDPFSVEMPLNN